MKVIAFLNNKGGVGKTASVTTVAHIAATYSQKKVLLIDLDPQGNSSALYNDANIEELLSGLLQGKPVNTIAPSVENLLIDKTFDIHEAIRKTHYENLDIIPSYLTLAEVEERLKADILSPQQFRLANQLEKIKDEYDYCFLDCSPSISIININGLVAADEVYIPLKCDAWSAIGMCIARNLISTVTDYNRKLKLSGIFFTQWEGHKNVSQAVYGMLNGFVSEELLPITIRKSKLIEELSLMQKPLLAYDDQKGYSKITKEYIALTEYILSDFSGRVKIKQTYNNKTI